MTPEVVVNSGIAEPLMTGPASTPACLPLELWECVLLQLTPWEALKLRRVRPSSGTQTNTEVQGITS